MPTLEGIINQDMPWLRNHQGLMREIAATFGLDLTLVAAVISRESGGGRLLGRWGSAAGTGDAGHGRGLMQIDDRWHRKFTGINSFWETAAGNVSYGCHLLSNFIRVADKRLPVGTPPPAGPNGEPAGGQVPPAHATQMRKPEWKSSDPDPRLCAAIAAYNCGFANVMRALKENRDVDAFTTGQDYSSDVLERRKIIRAYEDWTATETLWPAASEWKEDKARVRQIQRLLNIVIASGLEVDGDYGPRTAASIEHFQGKQGLLIDGDCDEITWRELVEMKARIDRGRNHLRDFAREHGDAKTGSE